MLYKLQNTARRPGHKTQRALSPHTPKLNLLIAGGTIRVGRGHPTTIHADTLNKHRAEITQLVEEGVLIVMLEDGREVDINTLEPKTTLQMQLPLPSFPMDSVSLDQPTNGHVHAQMWQGAPATEALPLPAVVQRREELAAADREEDVEEAAPAEEPEEALPTVITEAAAPVKQDTRPQSWVRGNGKKGR